MSKEKTTALQKYADIRKQTTEQQDAERIELDVERAENQINTDLHNAKSVVIDRKNALQTALKASVFNTSTVLNAKRQLLLAEKDVQDITALKAELF